MVRLFSADADLWICECKDIKGVPLPLYKGTLSNNVPVS